MRIQPKEGALKIHVRFRVTSNCCMAVSVPYTAAEAVSCFGTSASTTDDGSAGTSGIVPVRDGKKRSRSLSTGHSTRRLAMTPTPMAPTVTSAAAIAQPN